MTGWKGRERRKQREREYAKKELRASRECIIISRRLFDRIERREIGGRYIICAHYFEDEIESLKFGIILRGDNERFGFIYRIRGVYI